MSEEEKEEFDKIVKANEELYCDKKDVTFLINLIKKQQKELEEKDKLINIMKEKLNNISFEVETMWKDKLREKMKYYTELYKQDNSPNDFLISQSCLSKLSLLQELLGEEDE